MYGLRSGLDRQDLEDLRDMPGARGVLLRTELVPPLPPQVVRAIDLSETTYVDLMVPDARHAFDGSFMLNIMDCLLN